MTWFEECHVCGSTSHPAKIDVPNLEMLVYTKCKLGIEHNFMRQSEFEFVLKLPCI